MSSCAYFMLWWIKFHLCVWTKSVLACLPEGSKGQHRCALLFPVCGPVRTQWSGCQGWGLEMVPCHLPKASVHEANWAQPPPVLCWPLNPSLQPNVASSGLQLNFRFFLTELDAMEGRSSQVRWNLILCVTFKQPFFPGLKREFFLFFFL